MQYINDKTTKRCILKYKKMIELSDAYSVYFVHSRHDWKSLENILYDELGGVEAVTYNGSHIAVLCSQSFADKFNDWTSKHYPGDFEMTKYLLNERSLPPEDAQNTIKVVVPASISSLEAKKRLLGIMDTFANYLPIRDVKVNVLLNSEGKHRGIAFLKCDNAKTCALVKMFLPGYSWDPSGGGKMIRVSWYRKKEEKKE